jgi:hypothetical protein
MSKPNLTLAKILITIWIILVYIELINIMHIEKFWR